MRIPNFVYLLIVVALAGLSGFVFQKTQFKEGLDIRGGSRFTLQMDFSELTEDQKQNMELVRKNTLHVLERRVASVTGVVEANVALKGVDQVIIELPGETNIDEARKILTTTASIKYYHARTVTTDKSPIRMYEQEREPQDFKGVDVYNFRLRTNATKVLTPGTPEYKTMIRSWGQPILQGSDLASANVIPNRNGYAPQMNFSSEGAKKIERWCRQYLNKGENLAAVLDDQVLSIAPLKDGTILKDNAFIDGEFDTEFVRQLVNTLNAGALPVSLKELSAEQVDPTIGKEALSQILRAGGIALGITAAFVVIYYSFPGLVALLALCLYALFTVSMMKFIGATFSLAAIAGLVLSVGMAVDANILIFERIKEELRLKKTLKAAVDLGFKRALPAIIDSNACTILTSLVLMALGTGPVKGFATTLIMGVAISLFTAVTVTRWILTFLISIGIGTNPSWYALKRQWFGEGLEAAADSKVLHIVEKRKLYFGISLATIVIPGLFFFMGGLKPNVEFLGGYESVYSAQQGMSTADYVKKLGEVGFTGGNVKLADGATTGKIVYVTIPPQKDFDGKTGDVIRTEIREKLGFTSEQDRGFTSVGPTVQREAIENAIKGVIFSSALIVLYLSLRFGFALGGFRIGLRFAMSAIGALLHDVLVVIALAAMFGYLFGWEVSALFITGMLTVIGFSTHDTIVIFDRIRENLHRVTAGEEIGHLINRSITQSIARSINTSATIIVTLLLLIFIGSATPDLKFFNTIMLCGIVSGTYSSIFNASPILYVWDKWIAKKNENDTLLAIARRELAHAHVAQVEVKDGAAAPMESQAYGQVTRRRRASDKGHINLDE